jgi:hypothetical protein
MVATAGADEVQVEEVVRFWVLPSLYVPVAVYCWVPPAEMDTEAGVTAIEERVAPTPVPLRLTVWGVFTALSVTVMVPVRVPEAVGVKLMVILQLAPAPSVDGLMGQLLVCEKSAVLAAMLVIFSE